MADTRTTAAVHGSLMELNKARLGSDRTDFSAGAEHGSTLAALHSDRRAAHMADEGTTTGNATQCYALPCALHSP